jgi:hypothetical protein
MHLTTKFAAALVFAAQAIAPLCTCGVAMAGPPAVNSCHSNCCSDKSSDVTGCTCSASSPSAPAIEKSLRLDLPPGSEFIRPIAAWTANLGLHGVDWQTAFDLMADDSPPGLRLHALFSVWRN